ncbi:MAG: hypothetical protein IJZ42_13405 [Lachnospiraceae bacterium]|nr:hypothetical protein [Lachnospiraceae bacterium]
MKRVGYIYEKIYDVDNIKLAIRNASKGKHNRRYVRKILNNIDYYAQGISDMLKNEEFVPSPNRTKTIKDGASQKERDITIPVFYPDQIVHWAIIQVIKPVFMKGMYPYSCGSVPGRGGLKAKKYVEKVHNRKNARYVLKMDIKKFFPSVSNEKLKELMRRKIKDKRALTLIDSVIDNGGKGLPIGYYTSQWFSNFYLQEMDHYIKEKLRIKYYVRYADDIVLMDSNKRKMRKARIALADFLNINEYTLEIKNNWQLWRNHSRPLDFVGYRFYKTYTRLRKKLFYRLTRVTRRIERLGLNIRRARRLNSLLGWSRHIYFRDYYVERIKPIVSKKTVRRYIGEWDRRAKAGSLCAIPA